MLYVPVKWKLQHLPLLGNPQKIFVETLPPQAKKAVQMPPVLGKLPDYCFNFSVASIMLLKLCM